MHVSRWSFALSALFLAGCRPDSDSFSKNEEASLPYACAPIPSCDAPPPELGAGEGFLGKKPRGNAFHRGHDQYLQEGQDQWIIGKFSYGNFVFRGDLRGEKVDIYLLRGCGQTWEKLGSAWTSSRKGENPTVEGVEDQGGRVYFQIPPEKTLDIGRHRLRLVVAGDRSATEMFVEVLPKGVPLFVSDVDGTLTTSELAELGNVIGNKTSEAHPFAPEALTALSQKGYRPYYLSARAENLVKRTREFLGERGFPAGAIETSQAGLIGLNGEKAVRYKVEALKRLQAKGFELAYGFGNTKTDAESYAEAGIPNGQRYFFRFEDETFGGQRIESYLQLGKFETAPNLCL
jgi:hypothetical protein